MPAVAVHPADPQLLAIAEADMYSGRCAVRPQGTLYYAFSGYDPVDHRGRVFLARSSDLGSSWSTTMLPWSVDPDLAAGEAGLDAVPSVAVDPNDPDAVYVD